MKTAEQFITFSQANVEALVKSSQIVATGLQDLTKLMAASAQSSLDEAMGQFRALTSVRSLKDALDLQATFARTAVEKTLSQTTQVAETSMKLAEQAMAPIASRMTVAAQSFGRDI